MTAELRPEWVCSECGVHIRWADEKPHPRPDGWAGDLCTGCTREGEEPEERARRLLLDGAVVDRVHRLCRPMSKKAISTLRTSLIESGDLSPDKRTAPKPKPMPKPKPRPPKPPDPKRAEAERLMRDDPVMSNEEISDLTGVSRNVVGDWRRKAGIPSSEAARRAEARALLAADPTLRNVEVKERMRYPVSSPIIRKVRLELGIRPPALN